LDWRIPEGAHGYKVPTEIIWEGKYKDGKKSSPLRISLPFQDVETVNESAQELGIKRRRM
jgi:hypothetical protein